MQLLKRLTRLNQKSIMTSLCPKRYVGLEKFAISQEPLIQSLRKRDDFPARQPQEVLQVLDVSHLGTMYYRLVGTDSNFSLNEDPTPPL